MFVICEADENEYRSLEHGENIFHKAHSLPEGRFRVRMPGEKAYDLVKIKNSDYNPEYFAKRWPGQTCFFEYEEYDEENVSSLYLDYLRKFDFCFIESVCEYTVVLCKLMLQHTNIEIFIKDERILWFIEDSRIKIVKDFPENSKGEILKIGSLKKDPVLDPKHKDMGPIGAFHNVFFLQGRGPSDFSEFKFAEIILDDQAGIGSILNNLSRYSQAFGSLGLSMVSRRESIGRFTTKFLNQCLKFKLLNEEANEENTFFMPETAPFVATRFLLQFNPKINNDILSDDFYVELNEYAEAVLGNRKALGVLIRGTDYILVNQNTERQMATVEEVIPKVDELMETGGYELIFLATEDKDILEKMRAKYGKKILVIAQERHSIRELEGKKLLADLEKEHENYEDTVSENTVNYFYALYMLSRCESFVCSGYCNGYELAIALNDGRYKQVYMYKEGDWIFHEAGN